MDSIGLPKLESALLDTFEAVIVTTPDLARPGPTIVYVNRAFEQMSGYSMQEALGTSPRILQGPRTDGVVLRRIRECLNAGLRCEGEIINYRKDGSELWLRWRICPVRDATQRITHWISFQNDISTRRRTARARGR